jgi:uncharacterized protein involved in tolerance to divalent cations
VFFCETFELKSSLKARTLGKIKIGEMVNVIIYLKQNEFAENLAKELVGRGLAAGASIDIDNSHFVREGDEVVKTVHTVLTLQTKALLFSQIVTFVEEFLGEEVPIYTVPITQTDDHFHRFIRERTVEV